VFGHGRKYLTALVEIDAETVADWARSHDVAYTGFTSLATNPAVVRLIGAEIERANGELARAEQIKAFRILPEELSLENGVMTPTRKKRRKQINERYQSLIASLYDESEEKLIKAEMGL